MMMTYNFKKLAEFGWFVGTTVATALAASYLVGFDPFAVSDWREWATGLVAAAARALPAALIAGLTKRRDSDLNFSPPPRG